MVHPLSDELRDEISRLLPELIEFIHRFIGRQADDEFIGEALLHVVKCASQWEGRCPLELFLRVCIRNRLRRMLARQAKEYRSGLGGGCRVRLDEVPDRHLDSELTMEEVLSLLPPELSRVGRMKFRDGLSVRDIADREGVSVGVAKRLCTKARKIIDEAIKAGAL